MGNAIVKRDRIGVRCSIIDVRGMEIAAMTGALAQLMVREPDGEHKVVVSLNREELYYLYLEARMILGDRPPVPR